MSDEEKQRDKDRTKKHQQENRKYWRELNKRSYLKKVGGVITRILDRTPEEKRLRALEKSLLRVTRAKQARVSWDLELTELVTKEAHSLRRLRNKNTNIDWHVDHIIPLKGKDVCGFHVWNNLAVIPKVENLRKGNKNSIHD